MTVVAFLGEGSTTTALASAVCWPEPDSIVVEMDPSGGCLSAWLDVPRSPGLLDLVSRIDSPHHAAPIAAAVQTGASGPRVIVAPVRAVECAAVVQAATRSVLPALTADAGTYLVDAGRLRGGVSPLVRHASVAVICHRQFTGSSAAAAVALERVAETASLVRALDVATVVALIGERPYPADEVQAFVDAPVIALASDPLSAAVLAGRPSSARRLGRSPLIASAHRLTAELAALMVDVPLEVSR